MSDFSEWSDLVAKKEAWKLIHAYLRGGSESFKCYYVISILASALYRWIWAGISDIML